MKEYEIVLTYLNGCSGSAYPQTSFAEAQLNDTDDYIERCIKLNERCRPLYDNAMYKVKS